MGAGAFGLYAAFTIVGSFNRETTGALLILFYAAFYGRAQWRQIAFLAALWVLITISLHVTLGAAPAQFGGLSGTLAMNAATWPSALFANALLLPLWIGTLICWRGCTRLQKCLLVCGGLYVLAFLVGAVYQEVRLLIVLFPLVLPVILGYNRAGRKSI